MISSLLHHTHIDGTHLAKMQESINPRNKNLRRYEYEFNFIETKSTPWNESTQHIVYPSAAQEFNQVPNGRSFSHL
jgi:hypothetical protein